MIAYQAAKISIALVKLMRCKSSCLEVFCKKLTKTDVEIYQWGIFDKVFGIKKHGYARHVGEWIWPLQSRAYSCKKWYCCCITKRAQETPFKGHISEILPPIFPNLGHSECCTLPKQHVVLKVLTENNVF